MMVPVERRGVSMSISVIGAQSYSESLVTELGLVETSEIPIPTYSQKLH
jgi:hypothetical protein